MSCLCRKRGNDVEQLQKARNKQMRMIHLSEHLLNNDRISDLPDAICSHILSFLLPEDALKTSLLSRRWKSLWRYVTRFDFNYLRFSLMQKELRKNEKAAFVDFVNWILQRHELSHVQKFRLSLKGYREYLPNVNDWIDFAVSHQCKELDLYIPNEAKMKLSDSVFTCESIEVLKLCLPGNNLRLPMSVSLCRLQTLNLKKIQFSDEDVPGKLISSCPLLENLSIDHCILQHCMVLHICHSKLKTLRISNCHHILKKCEIKIRAQSLQSFKYIGHMAWDFSLEDLASLNYACLYFDRSFFSLVKHKEYIQRLTNLLQGVANVKVLELCPLCIEYLSMPDVLGSIPLLFNNMNHLDITVYCNKDYILVISGLLKICPKIESFSVREVMIGPYWLPKSVKKPTPTFEMCHLKTVVMKQLEDENKVSLMRFLLKNTKVLKKIISIADDGKVCESTFYRTRCNFDSI